MHFRAHIVSIFRVSHTHWLQERSHLSPPVPSQNRIPVIPKIWTTALLVACVAMIAATALRVHKRNLANQLVEAAQAARISAERGNPDAEVALGDLYYHGLGVPQDYAEALRWFQKSADPGNPSRPVSRRRHAPLRKRGDRGMIPRRSACFAQPQTRTTRPLPGPAWHHVCPRHGVCRRTMRRRCTGIAKAADLGYARTEEHLGTTDYLGRGLPRDDTEAAQKTGTAKLRIRQIPERNTISASCTPTARRRTA